ncbi:MAG: type 3 dihydrofolate reductase [Woeseiaceae bacterium]
MISLIVAVSANNVIGVAGDLPWHLSEDLKRFKEITMGKPMIMGRATFESIGKALPGRRSIVMTHSSAFVAAGCDVVSSRDEAVEVAGNVPEIMVIGGGAIYELFMPKADRIYLTRVHAQVQGDTYFPQINADDWRVTESADFPVGDDRKLAFTFEVLERRQDSD